MAIMLIVAAVWVFTASKKRATNVPTRPLQRVFGAPLRERAIRVTEARVQGIVIVPTGKGRSLRENESGTTRERERAGF
ncbi:hypothetical protein L596_008652 [Steinernema carpocapsae]|uniref:Uncharacterized protein n=1 Tax=Steinernema carpocapsae TaxID=34508 RepID=A0A4U5PD50_STECR|nr:hypothetical protein L596_008652 [Steinernema carpocapsae]